MYDLERQHLHRLLGAAIAAAQPAKVLPPSLPDPLPGGKIIVVGAGKAAAGMAQATERYYASLGAEGRLVGEVATRHGYALPAGIIAIAEAGASGARR